MITTMNNLGINIPLDIVKELNWGKDEKVNIEADGGMITIARVEKVPNAETLEAIAEVQEMKKNPHLYKSYDDVDEMMRDILG